MMNDGAQFAGEGSPLGSISSLIRDTLNTNVDPLMDDLLDYMGSKLENEKAAYPKTFNAKKYLYILFSHFVKLKWPDYALKDSVPSDEELLSDYFGAYTVTLSLIYNNKQAVQLTFRHFINFFINKLAVTSEFKEELKETIQANKLSKFQIAFLEEAFQNIFPEYTKSIMPCLVEQADFIRDLYKFKSQFLQIVTPDLMKGVVKAYNEKNEALWLTESISCVELLIKSQYGINIDNSILALLKHLDARAYENYVNERASYQIHLLTLLNRFLNAKWPLHLKEIFLPTQVEILEAFMGAYIIALKMICDLSTYNEDIVHYFNDMPSDDYLCSLLDEIHLDQIEVEFLRVIKLEVNVFIEEVALDKLFRLGHAGEETFSVALLEDTKEETSTIDEHQYKEFIRKSLIPTAEDEILYEYRLSKRDNSAPDFTTHKLELHNDSDEWPPDSAIKRTILFRR